MRPCWEVDSAVEFTAETAARLLGLRRLGQELLEPEGHVEMAAGAHAYGDGHVLQIFRHAAGRENLSGPLGLTYDPDHGPTYPRSPNCF